MGDWRDPVTGFVKPGLLDFEVAAYAQYVAEQHGVQQSISIGLSSPPGRRRSSTNAT